MSVIASMGLSIHLLGVPRVERDGSALPSPRGHKVWGLLAYLLRCEQRVSRQQLAGLLFEDAEDPLGALRWTLSELRRLLGVDGLRGNELSLTRDTLTHVDIDVVLRGAWSEATEVIGLDRELLEGMNFAASPSFAVWLAGERRHLQAAAEAVLHEGTLALLARGEAAAAADLAGRLVRRNPLDEGAQALLVRCLAAAGDGMGAARQAAACRALFERELGVLPGPALDAALRTVTAAAVARPATGRAAAIAQMQAGEAAIGAGALDAGLQCLRQSIVEADATGDATLRARTRIALGSALVHAARGCDDEGATSLHEALAFGHDDAPSCAAAASRELGYVEFLRGRYDRALLWLRRASLMAGDDVMEQARIAIVHGAVLSDTAHYGTAIEMLRGAASLVCKRGDLRQESYALAMEGRVLLLQGEFDAAGSTLDRAVALAQQCWMAFTPWPNSLRGEVDLLRGDVKAAAARFEQAFALGCQLGDPCWEGIAGRGLGRVALARGDAGRAVEILVDATARCMRLPDAYLWGKGYALDVLCGLGVTHALPQASAWIDDLQQVAARGGMRELSVRSHLHRAALGDVPSASAARVLARDIDNPALHVLAGV
jgi:DNA-binding SARP family transcriptional activator